MIAVHGGRFNKDDAEDQADEVAAKQYGDRPPSGEDPTKNVLKTKKKVHILLYERFYLCIPWDLFTEHMLDRDPVSPRRIV